MEIHAFFVFRAALMWIELVFGTRFHRFWQFFELNSIYSYNSHQRIREFVHSISWYINKRLLSQKMNQNALIWQFFSTKKHLNNGFGCNFVQAHKIYNDKQRNLFKCQMAQLYVHWLKFTLIFGVLINDCWI